MKGHKMNTSELIKFCRFAQGQKEASLIIVRDTDELNKVKSLLFEKNFAEANSVFGLVNGLKRQSNQFIILNTLAEKDLKDIYDFVVQYPAGKLCLFDKEKMQTVFVDPDYENWTILLVGTKEFVFETQKTKYDLLSAVGLAYQE